MNWFGLASSLLPAMERADGGLVRAAKVVSYTIKHRQAVVLSLMGRGKSFCILLWPFNSRARLKDAVATFVVDACVYIGSMRA